MIHVQYHLLYSLAPPAGSPPEVSSVASRSVTLTWTKPVTKCEVVNYTVVYGGQVMWGNHATLEVNSAYSETTTINIAGLTPYSNYSFSVVAATAAGKGEPSLPTYCVTLEDAPSAPQNLLLEARSDALVVQWDAPAELNGVVVSYLVSSSHGGEVVTNQTLAAPPEQTRFTFTVDGLTAATDYNITVLAVTTRRGEELVQQFGTSSGKEAGVVVYIVIGVLLGVGLLVGLVVFIYKRDVICKKFQSPTSGFRETSTEQNELAAGLLQTIKQPLKDPRELTTAFAALRSRSRVAPTDEAASRPNIAKNRYQDILPFNDTRVKLRGEWSTDYINASYVKDAVGSVRFIACQGPKPGTVPDFWHMVWQEKVQFIVMLTNCYEKGKEKCCMYWSETRKSTFLADQYVMTLMDEDQGPDWNERRILLQNDPSPAREVVQLHFTSWPDFNVPASEAALLRLISSVRTHDRGDGVSCSHPRALQ
ncbi:receptor-type tyrosine-protein phosphatase C-like, partial [Hyalella azteca]|uniref:Receptor-type tyrosine-protein phosphatase C-like n=1 Tax=Hyalella azteca TaxID=294128 RepID=A0A979FVJ4_HYAAZ